MHTEPRLAVVVGSVDVGESSRIIRLLTAEDGRLAVMVPSARSSKRRWAGLLDAGTQLRVQPKQGRGDLPVLVNADLVVAAKRARTDIERLALLSYGCELCSALAPEHDPAPKLFGLLVSWLALLEGEAVPDLASRLALEAKALTFAGLAPMLVRCARCGELADHPAVFDVASGGMLHGRCGGGATVEVDDLLAIETLRRTPLAETPGRPAPPPFRWLLSDFARWHLGHALRTRGLLEDVT